VLEVDGLTVERESQPVLQDVSFRLAAGTDTAIVGPNGAGKSTLVQSILGILPHQSGQIRFVGQALPSQGAKAVGLRQQIAYLPQNFLFDRRMPMTVGELVGLGWEKLCLRLPWANKRQRRQAVHQALARVDAIHLQHRLLSELSGGETKRALLAYCVVRQRKLLILDEAPAGLDMHGEAEFYQLLYQLKQAEGWTILQISHDLEMVRQNCNQVLCLNRRLLCQGHPEQTLSPESLAQVYGSEFVRYRHRH
jgi:zinc/manganese transport system ATP-binding protein